MNRELIINVTKSEITIALSEDKRLVELNKESVKTGFAVGDIYLGRVRKIMPGLNAAFVNIGHEKDAFIHYLDLGPQFASLQKLLGQLTGKKKNVKFDTFKLEQPIGKTGKISSLLSTGQTIMVQVAKEAISTKGPRLTSDISLAGRNVVLIPFSNKISISQKIRSNEERKRLKKIATSVLPHNYGVIIRTAAQDKNENDIGQDILSLVDKWEAVLENVRNLEPPALLLGEMNRTNTILRDSLNGSFSCIAADDKDMYDEVKEYIKVIAPEQEKIVKLYKGKVSIFDHYDISRQIKSLFSKYVSLKRGAYLIIEHTEAMHVIDVNSGNRAKVADDQESTAMDVNLMAAEEIARQLRLRDMGGLIIVDFIDLHKAENRQKLYKTMQEFMAGDKAKHTVLPLSKFGLMQITRQRVRPEAIAHVEEVCPMCGGSGKVTSTVSIEKELENMISYYAGDKKIKQLRLLVSPYVAAYLKKGIFSVQRRWMHRYKFRLEIGIDQSLGMVEYQFLDRKGRKLL